MPGRRPGLCSCHGHHKIGKGAADALLASVLGLPVNTLPASLLRTQKATRTITTRTISHKNTKGLVPWGGLYPAATHSRGGGTPTLNLTSKRAPPAVRITYASPEPAFDGTASVTGMLADSPGRILTGEIFSHDMASAGLAEYVTSIGESPVFFTFRGVIG